MADYNLRLLTSLTDTDYIKVNESNGIQFGIFKANAFNSNGSPITINSNLQSDNNQNWTFTNGGLNIITPTAGSTLGTLGGIKFTTNNYSGAVAIGAYYNVGIINAPSVLTITSPAIWLGSAYASIMAMIDSNGLFIGGSTSPSARLHVKGSGTTSATTSFLVQDSAGNEAFKITDDRYVNFNQFSISSTGNGLSHLSCNYYGNKTILNYTSNGICITSSTISQTGVVSAIFSISSTTLGFLPPVMTTAQKNAIVTPAAGLVVFDSTLGKLCVFSTTWQTIASA